MPKHNADFDDDDELWDSDEDDVDDDTMPCPYCGAAIYDDAVRCPKCERYLSDEERPTTNQPRWVIITAALLLAGLLWAYLR